MFSIIIPLYNKSEYIEKCLLSVLNQTFQDFEVIVVDDGSTDDGVEKVKNIIAQSKESGVWSMEPVTQGMNNQAYKTNGTQIKLFSQPNYGVSTARNNGIKEAKYHYIAFLDADDWWEPTYLEEMKNLIEEFPEAGLYGSGYYIIKNGRKKKANIDVEPGFEKGIINYCQVYSKTLCMPFWTGAVVIPKKVFESVNGFKPALKLGEDFDLWLRTSFRFPVVLLNKPLAFYNQDSDITSRAIGFRFYEPSEHMIFSDYSEFNTNSDFRYLFEKLAMYDLLPYHLENKNSNEVNRILSGIHWEQHALKYRFNYLIFPKTITKVWMHGMRLISGLKRMVFIS
jgi:glycosyltransferase involved in cell wall biosynthesis